jgi:hypothetical protein
VTRAVSGGGRNLKRIDGSVGNIRYRSLTRDG